MLSTTPALRELTTVARKRKVYRREVFAALDGIRKTLDLQEVDIAERLCLTLAEYQKIRRGTRGLQVGHLVELCDSLNLSLDLFILGRLDLVALKQHHDGNSDYLTEKYTRHAYSRMRSVATYLEYLGQAFGPMFRQSIMGRFQLTESMLLNPSRRINIQFFKDVTEELSFRGLDESCFREIGAYSYRLNHGSDLSRLLSQPKKCKHVYEALFYEYQSHFEENCTYKIDRAKQDQLTITCSENKDLATALGVRHMANRHVCSYKAGLFSTVPRYIGAPPAIVAETSCVHEGADCCRFQVKLPF